MAVPMAFVPAPCSFHRAPSAKFIASAARERTLALPSSWSRTPAASLRAMRCSDSSAMLPRPQRMDLPASEGLVAFGGHGGRPATCGRNTRVARPLPRVGDRHTHPVDPAFADEPLPFSPQFAGMEGRGRDGVDGEPWIARHLVSQSGRPRLSKRPQAEPKEVLANLQLRRRGLPSVWRARTLRYSQIRTVNPRGDRKVSTLQVSWRATHRPVPVPPRGTR